MVLREMGHDRGSTSENTISEYMFRMCKVYMAYTAETKQGVDITSSPVSHSGSSRAILSATVARQCFLCEQYSSFSSPLPPRFCAALSR